MKFNFKEWLSEATSEFNWQNGQRLAKEFVKEFNLELHHVYPIMRGVEVGFTGEYPQPYTIIRDWWMDNGAHGVGMDLRNPPEVSRLSVFFDPH